MTPWLILGAVLVGIVIGSAVIGAIKNVFASAKLTGAPTPADAKAESRVKAQEALHAPDSDIAARIEQLRERGRAGK